MDLEIKNDPYPIVKEDGHLNQLIRCICLLKRFAEVKQKALMYSGNIFENILCGVLQRNKGKILLGGKEVL